MNPFRVLFGTTLFLMLCAAGGYLVPQESYSRGVGVGGYEFDWVTAVALVAAVFTSLSKRFAPEWVVEILIRTLGLFPDRVKPTDEVQDAVDTLVDTIVPEDGARLEAIRDVAFGNGDTKSKVGAIKALLGTGDAE